MKKTLLTAMAATLLFGSHAMAAKVTYEDAVASSSGFYEANNAVNKAPSTNGLGDREKPSGSGGANQMGKWVKVSNSQRYLNEAGDYSNILSSQSVGKACVIGMKGLLVPVVHKTKCTGDSSESMGCSSLGMFLDNYGYPAECR